MTKEFILRVIGKHPTRDDRVLAELERVLTSTEEADLVRHWTAKALVSVRGASESLVYFQKLGSREQYLGMSAILDCFLNSSFSYGIADLVERDKFHKRFLDFVMLQIETQAENEDREFISAVVFTFGGLFPLDRIVQDNSGRYVLNPEFLKGVQRVENSRAPVEIKQEVHQAVDRATLELGNSDRLSDRLRDQKGTREKMLAWMAAHRK